jgi:hypothetical protein
VCTLKSAMEQCDVVMSDHPDLTSAADAARQTVSLENVIKLTADRRREEAGALSAQDRRGLEQAGQGAAAQPLRETG